MAIRSLLALCLRPKTLWEDDFDRRWLPVCHWDTAVHELRELRGSIDSREPCRNHEAWVATVSEGVFSFPPEDNQIGANTRVGRGRDIAFWIQTCNEDYSSLTDRCLCFRSREGGGDSEAGNPHPSGSHPRVPKVVCCILKSTVACIPKYLHRKKRIRAQVRPQNTWVTPFKVDFPFPPRTRASRLFCYCSNLEKFLLFCRTLCQRSQWVFSCVCLSSVEGCPRT